MDRPGSEAVGIGAEAHVTISELFARGKRVPLFGGCIAKLYFVHVKTNSIHSLDPLDAISSR